jgi:cellulose biosynthesis protein BcsQ
LVPKKTLNELLFEDISAEEAMLDATPLVKEASNKEISGRLWLGFSSTRKEDIYRLDASWQHTNKLDVLRKLIRFRDELTNNFEADFIIMDTSPGIRFWSINILAIANLLLLTLKVDDLDIDGTQRMVGEIYGSLAKFGSVSYLLLNRVAGYCTPPQLGQTSHHPHNQNQDMALMAQYNTENISEKISEKMKMQVASSIPCYCDIQFSTREYLTSLKLVDHPFSKKIKELAEVLETR